MHLHLSSIQVYFRLILNSKIIGVTCGFFKGLLISNDHDTFPLSLNQVDRSSAAAQITKNLFTSIFHLFKFTVGKKHQKSRILYLFGPIFLEWNPSKFRFLWEIIISKYLFCSKTPSIMMLIIGFSTNFIFSDDAILSKILKLGRAELFSLNQRWMAGERASLREAFFKVTWEFHGMIGRWMEVVLWYTRELAKCERAFPFNPDVPFCFLVGILWKRWWQLSVHRMSGKMCSWK